MKVIYNRKEVGDNHNNYNRLLDKPLINSTELVGNITLNDINVYSKEEVKKLISSARSVKVALVLPAPLNPNTTYYIGPDMNGIYTVYLTDSSDPINVFSIGTTSFGKYYSGEGINVTDPSNIVSVLVDSESVIINSEGLLEARPVFEKMVPFKGATASADGSGGIVPKPNAGDQDKFLAGDSTWKSIKELCDIIHPVGSFFMFFGNPATAFPGTTWSEIEAQKSLQTISSGSTSYISAGVPDIQGHVISFPVRTGLANDGCPCSGAFSRTLTLQVNSGYTGGGTWWSPGVCTITFSANYSNSIYQSSGGVLRPRSTGVRLWRRTA